MQSISKFSLALLAVLALGASSVRADAPLRSSDLNISALLQVSDASGNPPTSPDTELYDKRPRPDGSLTQIIAPDGHAVTWGEWAEAEGRAQVKCIKKGSHVVVHLSGLIPNGLYTAWIPVFVAPFSPATFPAGVIAAGPLGAQDGSENSFVADADGVGNISGVLPPGALNGPIPGPFDGCLTDEVEFHVHIAYHIDGTTHGHLPGPPYTWVLLGLFDFIP